MSLYGPVPTAVFFKIAIESGSVPERLALLSVDPVGGERVIQLCRRLESKEYDLVFVDHQELVIHGSGFVPSAKH